MIPTRHQPTPAIRARFGERIDRLGPMLLEGDPLADAVVEALADRPMADRRALIDRALTAGIDATPDAPDALRALFAQLDHVPFWVDFTRANRGADTFVRAGALGGLVLGMKSLAGAYCSPAGNKPLVFSGRLAQDVPRRLAETGRFVQLVTQRDGLRRHGAGHATTVRVRLMHAQVRRGLVRSSRWDAPAWGAPINQFDMAATVLLFSLAVLDGLRMLGMQISAEQAEDLLHLWRYDGYLMGVRDELLCTSLQDARDLWDMIEQTQGPPDADSRALARALLEHPLGLARTPEERARAQRFVGFSYGVGRYLLGDAYADGLGFPKTAWRWGLPAIRMVVGRADALRRTLPGIDQLALDAGLRYWHDVVSAGLGGQPASFAMPEGVQADAPMP